MRFQVTITMELFGSRDSYRATENAATPTDEHIIEYIKDGLRNGSQPLSKLRDISSMNVEVAIIDRDDAA